VITHRCACEKSYISIIMTSITWAGSRCVQEPAAILAPQNRTQGRCESVIVLWFLERERGQFEPIFCNASTIELCWPDSPVPVSALISGWQYFGGWYVQNWQPWLYWTWTCQFSSSLCLEIQKKNYWQLEKRADFWFHPPERLSPYSTFRRSWSLFHPATTFTMVVSVSIQS